MHLLSQNLKNHTVYIELPGPNQFLVQKEFVLKYNTL